MYGSVLVTKIRNIGPASARLLDDIGIHGIEDVVNVGVVETYKMVKMKNESVSLNLLYSLQAAVMDIDWRDLPLDVKKSLINSL